MEIKFDKNNYRNHSDKNKKLIKKSLENCGAGRSIVIDSENEIIAGNGIYEQAQKLGLKTKIIETDGSELVVVKRIDLKTDSRKRKELALADNAIADKVEWNYDNIDIDFGLEELYNYEIKIPELKEIKDISEQLNESYEVVIECEDEKEQEKIYNEMIGKGLKCRILTL